MTHCAECGQPVHPLQLTCGSCGASLRPASTETAAAPEPPPPGSDATASSPHEGSLLHAPSPGEPRTPAGDSVSTGEPRRRPTRTRARTPGPAASPAFFARAWALVVDGVLLSLAASALPWVARLGIRAAEAVSGEPELYDDVITEQLVEVGRIALAASYFLFLTAGTGQTVGKALMGLRVVRVDGRAPDLLQSFVRLVGYVFSALPFGFGFLIAAFSPRRALHDYLAGTLVVRPRDMPRPESEDRPE